MSITFTEFGRRAYSNESYGTDHGTATPVFVFGTKLNNGIYGENPLLGSRMIFTMGTWFTTLITGRIYTSIIQDWFEGDNQALIDTGFAEWVDQKIPIVSTTGVPGVLPGKNPNSLQIFPNPVSDLAQLQFMLSRRGEVKLHVIDSSGRTREKLFAWKGFTVPIPLSIGCIRTASRNVPPAAYSEGDKDYGKFYKIVASLFLKGLLIPERRIVIGRFLEKNRAPVFTQEVYTGQNRDALIFCLNHIGHFHTLVKGPVNGRYQAVGLHGILVDHNGVGICL